MVAVATFQQEQVVSRVEKIVPAGRVSPPSLEGVKKLRKSKWFLTEGNLKLGAWVAKWSLPAGPKSGGGSCTPTSWCACNCYARKGRYVFKNVRERHRKNWQRITVPGGLALFVATVPVELRVMGARECRIHDAGDFFSEKYIEAWIQIVRACPRVEFWAYTHNYHLPWLREAFERLRALPNMNLFASVDPSSTEPTPEGWRVALAGENEVVAPNFRGITCPVQLKDRFGRMVQPSCQSCGYCFTGGLQGFAARGNVRFIPH